MDFNFIGSLGARWVRPLLTTAPLTLLCLAVPAFADDDPEATDADRPVDTHPDDAAPPGEAAPTGDADAPADPEAIHDAGITEDIVVTATRTDRSVVDAPASISVISGEDLRAAPVADLTDALRELPGVSLTAGSQGRRAISLRGMDSSYTLILIDGRRVNSSEAVFRHNDFDIGMLPVEVIERIEVVRGAMSSLYGSDALGGVVNIITRKVGDRWTGGVSMQLQTPTSGTGGQEGRASLYAAGPLVRDKLALRVTGTLNHRRIWHGASDPTSPVVDDDGEPVIREDGSVVERGDIATLEGRDDHVARGTLIWTPDARHEVLADYGFAHQERRGEYWIGGSYGDADSLVQRQDATLTHRGSWGWGDSEIRAYWEGVDTAEDELRQDNLVAEGHVTTTIAGHLLTFGADARATQLVAEEEFADGGASVHQEALYAQGLLSLFDRVTLLLGGRVDHHATFGLWGTPRAYAVVEVTDDFTVKGGVGTGFKAPTLRQISSDSVTRSCRGGCLIVGDEDLLPESSTNVELSALWDTDRWGASVTGFQNDVRNLIDTPRGEGVEPVGIDDETGLPMFVPRNVNRARIRGVEAGLRVQPVEPLKLTASVQLLDAVDLEADVPLDLRPKHQADARVDLRIVEPLAVFGRVEYVGEQRSGEDVLEPYALVDVGVTVEPDERLTLRAGVLNVTNTRTLGEAGYAFQERARTAWLGASARF